MMQRYRNRQLQAGYSLIELSIATAILGTLLIMLASIFINLVRQERGAVNQRDAIQSTRTVLTDIAVGARVSTAFKVTAPDADGFNQLCLYEGGTEVHYFVGTSDSDTQPGLYKVVTGVDTDPNCTAYTDFADAQNQGTPTRLYAANLSPTSFYAWSPTSALVPLLTLRVGTGTSTSLSIDHNLNDFQGIGDPSPGNCKPTADGSCAVSVLETSISLRGEQQ